MNLLHHYFVRWLGWFIPLTAGLTLIIAPGCQMASPAGQVSQTQAPVQPTATLQRTNTPPVESAPTITTTAIPESETLILTFWTTEAVSPKAEGESGNFMTNSLKTFETNNPNIQVELLLKKPSGKGGVLDFLRTARQVAPSILPDIAIMNATDLNQADAAGLLQTLDNRLDRSIVQDLLPAARKMGTVDQRLVGVPLSLEMEHMVYNTKVFTAAPMLWSTVLSSNTRYLFPAKGINGLVNDTTLSQYFSAGGAFHTDQETLKIDDRVLRNVLTFYQQALENNVIDATLLEAATTEELWPTYLDGKAGLTQIGVRQYLTDRDSFNNSTFAAIPVQTEKDTPVAITHGWTLVLITDDINRQRAALRLIEWFLSTSNNATWNNLNKSIPSRDSAFQQLAGDDPYWAFLTEQLNSAQPQPGFSGYDQLGRILQQAVEQVIRGEATPDEATATAVDALTP
ncbi:MAG: extracellular solute-binding protein [Anaerolineae bacterium]|nr:extracellular solute-binding protein [Anaerolineae bacterium]